MSFISSKSMVVTVMKFGCLCEKVLMKLSMPCLLFVTMVCKDLNFSIYTEAMIVGMVGASEIDEYSILTAIIFVKMTGSIYSCFLSLGAHHLLLASTFSLQNDFYRTSRIKFFFDDLRIKNGKPRLSYLIMCECKCSRMAFYLHFLSEKTTTPV